MDFKDLDKIMRRQIESELEKQGVPKEDFDPSDVAFTQEGRNIKVTYRGIEISIPAPSQEAIDSWWKENSKVVMGAVIALAGVVVGGWVASKTQE
jgi:hypothetical protein